MCPVTKMCPDLSKGLHIHVQAYLNQWGLSIWLKLSTQSVLLNQGHTKYTAVILSLYELKVPLQKC